MNEPTSPSRLTAAFAAARAEGRSALVCYAMGGDPSLAATETLLLALDRAGADVIELGVPFSDPIADGPTLQASAVRALAGGASVAGLLALCARLRGKLRAPLVLMGYVNPFEAYGLARFAADAAAAGVAGAIVPDLPLEEAGPLRDALAARGVDLVPLVAPTTAPSARGRSREAREGSCITSASPV